MDGFLIRERYKVVRTVRQQKDYAAVEAVDIQIRELPTLLLNLYEGDLLRRYGRLYAQIGPGICPAFQGAFLEGETLVAAFQNGSGTPIDQVFFQGDSWDWQERLYYAEKLLHRALLLSDLPPEIGCAALLSDNLRVDRTDRRVDVCFLAVPLGEMNSRELALLAGDQLKKILPRRLAMPEAQRALLARLEAGTFSSMAALYADWRRSQPDIRAGYEQYDKMNVFQKVFFLAKRWLINRKRGGRKWGCGKRESDL